MAIEYKIVNGTSYRLATDPAVVSILEQCRERGTRISVAYGNTTTGKDWGEERDIVGRVGRSCGPVKVPLLEYNRRSIGGSAALDHCIVLIQESRGGRVLYSHPAYHVGE